jgi:hypothetical protein
MKLPHQKFWMLLWCWTIEDPILQTVALTDLSEKTVRHWFGEFRAHLPRETHILERIVQMDEAYFTNMALLMAKQKGTRHLAYQVIPGGAVNRGHTANFLFQKVKPGSRLWTDGAAIYKAVNYEIQ